MMISIIVAGACVVALLAAGTILRMQTHNLGPVEAFCSFVSDTFHPSH